jgi:hypothetical protein
MSGTEEQRAYEDLAPVSPISTLVAAFEQLAALASRDEEARRALIALGGALMALASAAPPAPQEAEAEAAESPSAAAAEPPDLFEMIRNSLRGLQQQEVAATAPPPAPAPPVPRSQPARPEPAFDADVIRDLARCFRQKAAAAEWAALTREAGAGSLRTLPADIQGEFNDASFWFCDPQSLHSRRVQDYRALRESFTAVADALTYVDLMAQTGGGSGLFEPVHALAEAQSMVRVLVRQLAAASDPDQEQVHRWLRTTTDRDRIYLPRYMRLTDSADPADAVALSRRIDALGAPIRERRRKEVELREASSLLDYHLDALAEGDADDNDRHWAEVIAAIEALVMAGAMWPSDRDLRERLLPLLDQRPPVAVGPGMAQVLREIDRYLAGLEREEAQHPAIASPSPDVARVTEALRGKSIVFIGGERRVEHQERIERAFELREIIWLEGYGHSYTTFESSIARPDVVAVFLAVRWASHESGNVQRYCDEYGKPLIMLPGGYNENQMAAQILSQAWNRLGRAN